MKRWWVFLFLMCMFVGFVSGSVKVNNVTVIGVDTSEEIIGGEINLTVYGEDYDEKITSNDGDEIGLVDFLNLNGVAFDCTPSNCLKGYKSSEEITDGKFVVPASGQKTIGIVVVGEKIEITGLEFKIESDFGESYRTPLSIDFFGKKTWKFNNFSNTLLPKEWGCYDWTKRKEGPKIGKSLYCEKISIPDTGSLLIGVDMIKKEDESTINEMNMTIYPGSEGSGSDTCEFYPSSGNYFCAIEEFFPADDYLVCVNAQGNTNYYIYEEDTDKNCGFAYSFRADPSIKDYAIFAQPVKYANFSFLKETEFNSGDINDDLIKKVNEFIKDKDCLSGCVLPISFSGVAQNVIISDLQLNYTARGELVDNAESIHDLEVSPVDIDFSGVLNLSLLGFKVSKSMNYIVRLSGDKLFNKAINILDLPQIKSVLPLNPPAGVPIRFYADVYYKDNSSLSYKWNFGDGQIVSTSVPYVLYTYENLSRFTLTLEASAGWGLTSKKTFDITTVSPEIAISFELAAKQNALNQIVSSINSSNFWYEKILLDLIDVTFFKNELNKSSVAKNNASTSQDFVDVAEQLYALNTPSSLNVEILDGSIFTNKIEDVNIDVVAIAGGKNYQGVASNYLDSILSWQNENIDVNFSDKKFMIALWNGEFGKSFSVYTFNLTSKAAEESYFVINTPLSELSFKKDVGAKSVENSTVIVLTGGGSSSFEFYSKEETPVSFFVSPKLSSIIIEDNIDTSCNYNSVCENQYGENPINCRNDCKPVKGAVIYFVLILIAVLILYTILQIWYKRRYEKYLFKDRRHIYNLLMYISNARAREMKDSRIAAILREKGWSSERVKYVIKKSRGKRTGLVEIIPIEKVKALFRNKKARDVQAAKVASGNISPVQMNRSNIVTGNRQQMGRNINKSGFQRRI